MKPGWRTDSFRWVAVGCLLLLAVGAARILEVAGHEPAAGYANNFDMVRLQGCVRTWPTEAEPYQQTPTAPQPFYRIDFTIGGPCHLSSELALLAPAIGWGLFQPDRILPLQAVGLVKAAIFIGVGAAFTLLLLARRDGRAALAHGAIFALVLADPANTLYLNTFYAEFSALLFFYMAAVLLYLVGPDRSPPWLGLAFAAALLLLGLSKPQHQALPALLLLCALPALLRRRRRATLALGVVAVLTTLVFHNIDPLGGKAPIRLANATNALLGAVLPQMEDRAAALRRLGLPAACEAHIGKTWYTAGVAAAHPCPEVAAVPRARWLALFVQQPAAFHALSRAGIERLRPWRLDYLGELAGQSLGRLQAWSLSAPLAALPAPAWAVLWALPGFYLFAALVSIGRGGGWSEGSLLCCALASGFYLVFYSALFGDGFFEFPKHNHLLFSMGASGYLIAMAAGVHRLSTAWRSRGSPAFAAD